MVAQKNTTKKERPQKSSRPTPKPEVAKTSTPVVLKPAIQRRRTLVGVVVSDKMQKTIVVKVDRRVRHPLYKKYLTSTRRFKVHDEKNTAKSGDLVCIIESRPLSREKRWALKEVLRKGTQTLEVAL